MIVFEIDSSVYGVMHTKDIYCSRNQGCLTVPGYSKEKTLSITAKVADIDYNFFEGGTCNISSNFFKNITVKGMSGFIDNELILPLHTVKSVEKIESSEEYSDTALQVLLNKEVASHSVLTEINVLNQYNHLIIDIETRFSVANSTKILSKKFNITKEQEDFLKQVVLKISSGVLTGYSFNIYKKWPDIADDSIPSSLVIEDIKFLMSFQPFTNTVDPGLMPMDYLTGTYEGDIHVRNRIQSIKEKYNI